MMADKYSMQVFAETLALDSDEDPRPGRDGLTLLHAMRVFCPVEWYEYQEVSLSPRPPFPTEAGPDAKDDRNREARERTDAEDAALRACYDEMIRRLRAGELRATGFLPGDVKAQPIEAAAWSVLGVVREADLAESIATGGGTFVRGVRVFASQTPKATVDVEKRCEKWLRSHLRATKGKLKYEETLAIAKENVSPDLSERAFRRAWAALVPENRKHAARPRKASR
jgi:hypothetical protein